MKREDITPEWVEKNCEIKRQKKQHSYTVRYITYDPTGYTQFDGTVYHSFFPSVDVPRTVEETVNFIESSVDYSVCQWVIHREKTLEGYIEDSMVVRIRPKVDHDPYDDWGEPTFEVRIDFKTKETREEAIKRIIKREKAKISRAASKKKKEDAEREEFLRLKEKFGE